MTARDTRPEAIVGRARLMMLAAATLLAPAVLIVQAVHRDFQSVIVAAEDRDRSAELTPIADD